MAETPVNYRFECVWLDGYTHTAHLRSKTKALALESYAGDLEPIPGWSFDGSSTEQAEDIGRASVRAMSHGGLGPAHPLVEKVELAPPSDLDETAVSGSGLRT
jgi:hypothetical protein